MAGSLSDTTTAYLPPANGNSEKGDHLFAAEGGVRRKLAGEDNRIDYEEKGDGQALMSRGSRGRAVGACGVQAPWDTRMCSVHLLDCLQVRP